MTSLSSVNNAALLILQRANVSDSSQDSSDASAADRIAAIVNGVSSEDSAVKIQASSTINSGLLDIRQANDSIVSHALDFLDSDGFKSSDPSIKDALKQLISDESNSFAALVKAEKAKNPRITDDNAMANAIQGLIKSNRDKFTDDEFVIGSKLTGGGAILANIEDIDGNSTSKTLTKNVQAQHAAFTASVEALIGADKNDPDALKAASAGLKDRGLFEALEASYNWTSGWREAFGF